MHFYRFLLGTLSVWRITHLLYAEDGPWDIVVYLQKKADTGFWGQLLDCFYCLSVWVAAPFALFIGQKTSERVLLWPALSACAILIKGVTDRGNDKTSTLYIEENEEDYVLR